MTEITHVVIVNRACAMIGEEPLQGLDEDTPFGGKASLIYDSLLDFCLALTPWTFARQTVELNREATAVLATGFTYHFTIPKGFKIKPNRLTRSRDESDIITAFEFEGDKLHCDDLQVFAQLIIEQHPERWAGDFRHAFTCALAGEFALAMADDRNVANEKKQEAFGTSSQDFRGGLMGAAIRNDARNSPVRRLGRSDPLTAAWSS